MKLRNKKTGEIMQLSVKCENGGELRTFDLNTNTDEPITLAELNEEWEDYEEPKEYWFIDIRYPKVEPKKDINLSNSMRKRLKEIGNYFETREEAEKAVEKLKAWKRLKNLGFKFIGKTCEYKSDKHFGSVFFEISEDILNIYDDNVGFYDDLELLFGGK